MIQFAVITSVGSPLHGDNLDTGPVFLHPQALGDPDGEWNTIGVALARPVLDVFVRVPVFKVGELLVVTYLRDQFGRMLDHVSGIDYEVFDTIDEAVARVQQFTGAR